MTYTTAHVLNSFRLKCYIKKKKKKFNTFKALNARLEVHDALVKPMCAWSFTWISEWLFQSLC